MEGGTSPTACCWRSDRCSRRPDSLGRALTGQDRGSVLSHCPASAHLQSLALQPQSTEGDPTRLCWPITLYSIYNSVLQNGVSWDGHSIFLFLVPSEQITKLWTLNLVHLQIGSGYYVVRSCPCTHDTFFSPLNSVPWICTDIFMINIG